MRKLGLLLLLSLGACAASGAQPGVALERAALPPVPLEQVQVLTSAPAPGTYQIMGRAYAWSPLPVDTQKGYTRAVAELRNRAALVGASAIRVPAPEEIGAPAIQSRWMERVAGMVHYANGQSDYVRPQELMAVLLVKSN